MNNNKKLNMPGNTKERLIEVALELFAIHSYEGVSTRQIVDKAKVNISAITYYFGGKEGLYKAVIESKIDLFENKMGPVINEVLKKQNNEVEEQKQLLLKLLDEYITFIFSKGLSQYIVLLLIREMTSPSSTFELFYAKVMGRMHKLCTKLLAAIFNRDEQDEEMILLTTTLIGQILIFRATKRVILRRINIEEYDEKLLSKIKQIILKNVEIIVNNWRPL